MGKLLKIMLGTFPNTVVLIRMSHGASALVDTIVLATKGDTEVVILTLSIPKAINGMA